MKKRPAPHRVYRQRIPKFLGPTNEFKAKWKTTRILPSGIGKLLGAVPYFCCHALHCHGRTQLLKEERYVKEDDQGFRGIVRLHFVRVSA
jgi:hypothetical protein